MEIFFFPLRNLKGREGMFWIIRFCFLLLMLAFQKGHAQSLTDLDINPSFKSISIGAPISKYNGFLKYQGTDHGINSYTITDSHYLSVFNIMMNEGVILEKEGKVNAIILAKYYAPSVFNPKELEVLISSLTFKYGSPNVNLDDFSGTPTVVGARWQARTVKLDIIYLFYGTDISGSGLRYILYERNDDY